MCILYTILYLFVPLLILLILFMYMFIFVPAFFFEDITSIFFMIIRTHISGSIPGANP